MQNTTPVSDESVLKGSSAFADGPFVYDTVSENTFSALRRIRAGRGAEAVWLPLPWFHHRAIPVTSVAAYARKKGSRAWPHDVYGLLLWTPDSRGES